MKTKFILAGLAGGVVDFLLGWLVYGLLLMKFFEANTTHYVGLAKEMPLMWLLIPSCLVMGFFLAFIFSRWANISTWKDGFIGGLIIGLFLTVMYDLSFMSMYNLFGVNLAIVDVIAGGIVYGLTGAVVGWILGTKGKTL